MKGKAFQVGIIVFMAAAMAFSGMAFGQSKELPLVRASHQPCMHALPTILATNFGWWDEIGIRVSFHYFVSGMPQVEAGRPGNGMWGRSAPFLVSLPGSNINSL